MASQDDFHRELERTMTEITRRETKTGLTRTRIVDIPLIGPLLPPHVESINTGSRSELQEELLLHEGNADFDTLLVIGIAESETVRREHEPMRGEIESEMRVTAVEESSDDRELVAGARKCRNFPTYSSSGLVHAGYVSVVPSQRYTALMKTVDVITDELRRFRDRGHFHGHGHGPAFIWSFPTILSSLRDVVNMSNGVERKKNVDKDTFLSIFGRGLAAQDMFLQAGSTSGGRIFMSADWVPSLACVEWPYEAVEFVTRERRASPSWPPDWLINDIVKGGCHLVKVAHPDSVSPDNEYRFSFSCAETLLLNSWTSCQKYVYHLLRILFKRSRVAGEEGLGVLRTYHFKTLMLWACENRPASCGWWDWSRMTACCSELLVDMFQWLADKRCPNYFIPANNMFDHIPLTTRLLREEQFLVGFTDQRQIISFIIAEESLLWPRGKLQDAVTNSSEQIREAMLSNFAQVWLDLAIFMLSVILKHAYTPGVKNTSAFFGDTACDYPFTDKGRDKVATDETIDTNAGEVLYDGINCSSHKMPTAIYPEEKHMPAVPIEKQVAFMLLCDTMVTAYQASITSDQIQRDSEENQDNKGDSSRVVTHNKTCIYKRQ